MERVHLLRQLFVCSLFIFILIYREASHYSDLAQCQSLRFADYQKLNECSSELAQYHGSYKDTDKNSAQQLASLIENVEKSRCSQGNKVEYVCSDKSLNQTAIACGNSDCQCRQKLKQKSKVCGWYQLQTLVSQVYQKKTESEMIVKVRQVHKQIIQYLNRMTEQFIQFIRNAQLLPAQKELLNKVSNEKMDQITGKQVFQIIRGLQYQNHDQQQLFIQRLKHRGLESSKNTTKFIANKQNYLYSIFNLTLFVNGSKIITSSDQQQILKKFFPQNKKPNALRLLYRASENDFEISKFKEKCNGIPNTVTLIQTEFGKIIGGYTPLTWKKGIAEDRVYYRDSSGQSFLFSVTENAKFALNQNEKQYAIDYHKNWGPQFGHHDLDLSDRSDKMRDSFSLIGHTYSNPAFEYRSQQTYRKFTGSSNQYFKTSEWEVYEALF